MKIKIIMICFFVSGALFAQNITNTLGSSGTFTIKDGSTNYFTLSQSSGQVNILRTLRLENTTSSTTGVIYKAGNRFIHNYGNSNLFMGLNSGNFTLTGSLNTTLGINTLTLNTSGSENVAIGVLSLHQNTTGYGNTAVGISSLETNSTGYLNTAVGSYSLFFNSTGRENTAVGNNSLGSNSSGTQNTAVGCLSLLNNGTGSNNSAFGWSSLRSNTQGSYNSAFGFQSLYSNIAGFNNSAFGWNALYSNTHGLDNSSFGQTSLYSNTNGSANSAFGWDAMFRNINGHYNSAFGRRSLYSNLTGERNTAVGDNSMESNMSGSFNTAIGSFSGNFTTGDNNTAIGSYAFVPSGSSNNQVRIGNTLITYAGIQVAWTVTSDRNLKSNIFSSNLGLGFITKLRPVSYTRKNDESAKTEYGLIAQEVEEVLQQEGIENNGMLTITDEGEYQLRYNDLIAPMIKAIQELNEKNEELSAENTDLKDRLTKYEQMQNVLAGEIEKLKDDGIKEINHSKK